MGDIVMTAVVRRGGDGFVALCPELNLAGYGSDASQALDEVREAVRKRLEEEPFLAAFWSDGGDGHEVRIMEFAV